MPLIASNDPAHVGLVLAIRSGDVDGVRKLLSDHPELAAATLDEGNGKSRSTLHDVTDWPGYFPNAPQVAQLLLDGGADPKATIGGASHTETPLHWAASSDDVDVAVVLIDAGADVEARGASIGGGPPLDNAVGYGCWHVARLLAARGAAVQLWHAAALGMLSAVEAFVEATPAPTAEQITEAFWQACNGGQRRTAEYLLGCGAELNGTPGWSDQTPLDVAGELDTRRQVLTEWLRSRGAESAEQT